jgi:hypothetical protein
VSPQSNGNSEARLRNFFPERRKLTFNDIAVHQIIYTNFLFLWWHREREESLNGESSISHADAGRFRQLMEFFLSREWELNPRPADYESAALPLSYLGLQE